MYTAATRKALEPAALIPCAMLGTREWDRRTAPRFLAGTPVRAIDPQGRQLAGVSRDLGPKGMFFLAHRPLDRGCVLEVFFGLKPGPIFSDTVLMRAKGRVVRIEKHPNGTVGIAVVFDTVKIEHTGLSR